MEINKLLDYLSEFEFETIEEIIDYIAYLQDRSLYLDRIITELNLFTSRVNHLQ